KFYDPTKIIEEWFDRTHNAFLDYFVEYGIAGLLLYLALIGAFFREAWILSQSKDSRSAYRGNMLILLAVVYGVQNFFVFDTAVTLWLLLALYASLLALRLQTTPRPLALPISILPEIVPGGIAVLIALFIISVSIQPLRANMALAQGYLYQIYDVRRAVGEIEKGWKLGTYADIEYGYQLYEWYTERQMIQLTGEARVLAYRMARDILAANFEKYPYDARTATYYAHVLDVAPKGEDASESLVREVLARAIELSPKRIQPRYLLANIEIKKGDAQPVGSSAKKQHYETAIQGLAEYSALVPDFAEPDYIIATLYLTLKEFDKAKEWADKGFAVYKKQDYNTAKRASRYYVAVEDWENARRFLAEVVSANPADYPVMYDLAKAEFLAGNAVRAKEIVEVLKSQAPGLVETDPAFARAVGE
ncbi:MAG: tetratricopeptide repeat protein, partial [Patescibacteria group bacterium]